MYEISMFGFKTFEQIEFLPGFFGILGLLIFSMFFFWLIGFPFKTKGNNNYKDYPLDVLNIEGSKYSQEIPISPNTPGKQLSGAKRYTIYGLSFIICFIPMTELLSPFFY